MSKPDVVRPRGRTFPPPKFFCPPSRKGGVVTSAQLRSSPRWKRARKIALRGATHCSVCRRPLDFDAPPRSRWAPSVDHIRELALGGDPFAQENLRPVHYGCNASL